jgi:hypothetical protein
MKLSEIIETQKQLSIQHAKLVKEEVEYKTRPYVNKEIKSTFTTRLLSERQWA